MPEEEEDFGGLMVCWRPLLIWSYSHLTFNVLQSTLKAASGKKKDKKKNKHVVPDLDEEEAAEAPVDKGPVQMTAEELADEEWGPVKDKKKGKKGKKGGKDADEEQPETPKGVSPRNLSLRHLVYFFTLRWIYRAHTQGVCSRARR